MTGSARAWMGVGLLLAAMGCAGGRTASLQGGPTAGVGGRDRQEETPDETRAADAFPTLLVENASGYQVTVRLDGRRIGTVPPGRRCLRIPQMVGELRLVFAAQGTRGYRAPIAFLEESAHWAVELRPGVTIKYDVLSLAPRRAACRA